MFTLCQIRIFGHNKDTQDRWWSISLLILITFRQLRRLTMLFLRAQLHLLKIFHQKSFGIYPQYAI